MHVVPVPGPMPAPVSPYFPRSLHEFSKSAWALSGWHDVFVHLCHGQIRSFCNTLARISSSRAGIDAAELALADPSERPLSPPEASGRDEAGIAKDDILGLGLLAPFAQLSERAAPPRAAPPVCSLLLWKLWSGLEEWLPSELLSGLATGGAGLDVDDRVTSDPESLSETITRCVSCLFLSCGSFCHVALVFVNTSESRRDLHSSATKSLRAYIRGHSRRLASAARSITESTDWGTAREPRRPREFCFLLLDSLTGTSSGS